MCKTTPNFCSMRLLSQSGFLMRRLTGITVRAPAVDMRVINQWMSSASQKATQLTKSALPVCA